MRIECVDNGMLRAPLSVLAVVLAALLVGPTGGAIAEVPQSTTQVPTNISGSYASNWGPVHLEQRGGRVVGSYECCGNGRITGTIEHGVIRYRWQQPGASGRGRWRVHDGGRKLIGTWGTDESETSGGPWDLEKPILIAE